MKSTPSYSIKTWKSITIGTGDFSNEMELLNYLSSQQLFINDSLFYKMPSGELEQNRLEFFAKHFVKFSDIRKKEKLVKVTPKDLGINSKFCEYSQIIKAANKYSLKLCHWETAFCLRIKYPNQGMEWEINNEPLFIFSDPFPFKNSLLVLEGTLNNPHPTVRYCLYAGNSNYEYNSQTPIIFRK